RAAGISRDLGFVRIPEQRNVDSWNRRQPVLLATEVPAVFATGVNNRALGDELCAIAFPFCDRGGSLSVALRTEAGVTHRGHESGRDRGHSDFWHDAAQFAGSRN